MRSFETRIQNFQLTHKQNLQANQSLTEPDSNKHCSRTNPSFRLECASRCHLPIQPNCQRSILGHNHLRLRGVTIVEAAFPGVNTTWPNFGIPFFAFVSLATLTPNHRLSPLAGRRLSHRFTSAGEGARMIQISRKDASPFFKISGSFLVYPYKVEVKGLEPMTLCLQSRCSPN